MKECHVCGAEFVAFSILCDATLDMPPFAIFCLRGSNFGACFTAIEGVYMAQMVGQEKLADVMALCRFKNFLLLPV